MFTSTFQGRKLKLTPRRGIQKHDSFTGRVIGLVAVDYGNVTLSGVPAYAISRLQSALNAAARLVFSLQKYDSVTLLLRELHWLKVEQRIEYKLAVLVVPPSRLSTVGDRAFPVAAARVWNSLPDFVTASTWLPMFKRHLKTVLFAKSY